MPARTNTFTSFVNDVDSLRYPTDPGSVDTLIPPLSYSLQPRPPFNAKTIEPVEVENSPEHLVQLARRRTSRSSKEKFSHRKATGYSRPQGRPLSKETTVRLTLVPTLGILYSLLVSDSMRKPLKVLKYSNEKGSVSITDEELSTRNAVSGFSSLLNVQPVKFVEDINSSPKGHSKVPQFSSIDEAVYNLFGISEYSLIRVTRAAASEIGGSVLLKLETAMPGNLYLNDDDEEDFRSIQLNKEMYQETLGIMGQRPSTTFLKKKVARPRYKADMRIYLIPRAITCAIYCEPRIFKRDLLRGFLNMNTGERSIISAFDYGDFLHDLKSEGNAELLSINGLPSLGEVEQNQKRAAQPVQQVGQAPAPEPLRGIYEALPTAKKTTNVGSYNSPQYEQLQVHQYPQVTYTQEAAVQQLYNHQQQQQQQQQLQQQQLQQQQQRQLGESFHGAPVQAPPGLYPINNDAKSNSQELLSQLMGKKIQA